LDKIYPIIGIEGTEKGNDFFGKNGKKGILLLKEEQYDALKKGMNALGSEDKRKMGFAMGDLKNFVRERMEKKGGNSKTCKAGRGGVPKQKPRGLH